MPYYPYATPIEMAVAKQMSKVADKNPIDFVLTLGDNFYFDGVKSVDDPRFTVWAYLTNGSRILKLSFESCNCSARDAIS